MGTLVYSCQGLRSFSFLVENTLERVEDALWLFRDTGHPFDTLQSDLEETWRELGGLRINPIAWFNYYNVLRDALHATYLETLEVRPILYIHATIIYADTHVPDALFRYCLYDFFYFHTPTELYHIVSRIKFRLLFMNDSHYPEGELFIENLHTRFNYSDPFYFELYWEQ